MSKKNILAISYLYPNSTKPFQGIFVHNRLNAMSKYCDIIVINPVPYFPFKNIFKNKHQTNHIPKSEKLDNLTVYHPSFFSVPRFFKFIEIFTYRWAVNRVVDKLDLSFDLIDLHWTFPDLPAGYYLSKKYRKPFYATLRGMEAFHLQDFGIRKHVVQYYLKRAKHVISLSQEMSDKANEISNTGSKTTVIRNGVDTNKFFYLDKNECRDKLGINLEEKIILGVGSLIYRKGFDIVINQLSKLKQHKGCENSKYYIIGSASPEGDYKKQLEILIDKNNLRGSVTFIDFVENEELVYWYNAADVFCLSSRGEGSPNVLSEALACGAPTVAVNVGSVPEIMESIVNSGTITEAGDNECLAFSIANQIQYAHDRKSKSIAYGFYNWDWCAKEIVKII